MDNALNPDEWVANYSDYLFNYALTRINHRELAEDLVQETFLGAYKGKDSFKGESSEKTWLVSILKRKIIDEYRKKGTQDKRLVSLDYFQGDEEARPGFWKLEHLISKKVIPGDADLENEELRQALEDCISALPAQHEVVFRLKNLQEMESEDIGKELNLSKSNLWVILHRARLALRECLKKKWFE